MLYFNIFSKMLRLSVFLCALVLVTCRPNLKIIGGDDADIADWP